MTDSQDRKGEIADLTSQLVALRCDLRHYTRSHSSPMVAEFIRERIRQLEARLAKVAQYAARRPVEAAEGVAVPAARGHR